MSGMVTGWVPEACTLPMAEQPLRLQEFSAGSRVEPSCANAILGGDVALVFDPYKAAALRDLTERESECCSLFTFSFAESDDGLHVDVEVPPAQAAVLNALAARSATELQP